MTARSVLAFAAVSLLVAGPAAADIVRDGHDVAGPLDLTAVKLGQHNLSLRVSLSTARPLPRLRQLAPHPNLRQGGHSKYLCLELRSASSGRRLLCPAGRMKHGRIGVGVSKLVNGEPRAKGSLSVPVDRGKRKLSLELGLRVLALRRGRVTFSALSSWSGPKCTRGTAGRGRRERATCRDRAPSRGEGRTRIKSVHRVGCAGISESKVFSGPRSRKRVALTFDDGPSTYTPQVLKILADQNVNATFFQIGEQVPAYPSIVRDVLADGNELANHSLRHESGPGVGSLRKTTSLIERASGFEPCTFRPPGGFLPSSTLGAAQSLGMASVLWDVDTRDWTLPGSGTIFQRATAIQPGSIVLMHDGGGNRSETVAALPSIIKNLKSRGYDLVTMTQLLGGHYRYREGKSRRQRRPLPDPGPFPRRREGP